MELKHIELAKLTLSPANMRAKGKADIANILPSVRARGVLVPLMVRPNGSPGTYEIVAGKRRFAAASLVAEENGGEAEPLPCAILDDTDDAAALEASLLENVARLDPDEVTRWETFTRLVKEGRNAEEIALTFGLTELQVKRTLALGNLCPRIRNLYRDDKLDAVTVRHLTLASKGQQRDWLALLDSPDTFAPTGSQLKAWLFGGASIPASAAIFDLDSFDGQLVSDLFGDERYFASAEAFWAAQRAAVEAKAQAYRDEGWSEVVVLEAGDYFHTWEHERRSKAKGGKVFISLSHRGEVAIHEGFVSTREARKSEQVEAGEKPKRSELTAPLTNYIDLHRHAVVRAKLAEDKGLALRVMLAHAMLGSGLWAVRVEPQKAASDAIAESLETAPSEAAFDARRRAVLDTLGFDSEAPTVKDGADSPFGLPGLVMALLDLPDDAVLDALAVVMAETLDVGTPLVECLGRHLAIDMADQFAVDACMLDLVKDREVLDALVGEVAGKEVAEANAKATGKVKRQILADCLSGANGRAKVERFVPRWMTFPPSAYTARGGVATVSRAVGIEALFDTEPEDHDPDAGGAALEVPEAEMADAA